MSVVCLDFPVFVEVEVTIRVDLVKYDVFLLCWFEDIGTHMDGLFVNCKSAIANAFNSSNSSLNLISQLLT
jgi:hypothetical protein